MELGAFKQGFASSIKRGIRTGGSGAVRIFERAVQATKRGPVTVQPSVLMEAHNNNAEGIMGLAWYAEKGPGDCMGPADDSEQDERIAALQDAAVPVIAAELFDQFSRTPAWISDAQGDFSQAEYDAIVTAILLDDAAEVGRITIDATMKSIRRSAEVEAMRRVERMDREDELRHVLAMMED